jgi:23S rRNA (guanosine2251-2'-O)-methyltransferase
MTSIRAIIKGIDEYGNSRRIETILYDKDKMIKNAKTVGYLKAVSDKYGFCVRESTADQIDELAVGNSHGGIIALATDRELLQLSPDTSLSQDGFYAMIEGIEDPYNFGYALRSLYACGCDGIILPERNWMSAAGVVCRSSAGASEMFSIYKVKDACEAIEQFKGRGYTVVCADENTDNVLGRCELKKPILLVVGGEKRGISEKIITQADIKVKIDYAREFRASLSAASATTMFAYEIMRQN